MTLLPATLQKLQQELAANPGPEAAGRILAEYCSFFGLHSAQKELWQLTGAALSHPDMPGCNNPVFRNELVFFCEFTQLLMEAVYVLQKNDKKVKNKTPADSGG